MTAPMDIKEAAKRVFPGDLTPTLVEASRKITMSATKLVERGVRRPDIARAVFALNHAADQEKAAMKRLHSALKELRDVRKNTIRTLESTNTLLKVAVERGEEVGNAAGHNTEG